MKLEDLKCLSKEKINLKDYIDFINYVKSHMEHPEWLGDFTIEELKNPDIDIWIFMDKKNIVSSFMSIKASEKSCSKLGVNYDFREVIDYGQIAVNPNYVGNSLQLQMLEFYNKKFKDNKIRYAVTTVHPDNNYCIVNLIKNRFILLDCKEFKRGTRNIYIKEL